MAEEKTQNAPAQQENNTAAPQNNTAAPPAEEKKFSQKEVDDIVKQRLDRASKGQPTKEELEEFRKYKESLKSDEEKRAEQQKSLDDATGRISALEKELVQSRVSNILHEQAAALGIDAKAVSYVAKLADLSDVLDADGKPDTEKIKAAVGKVLTDIPALKAQQQDNKGFIPIGSDGANKSDGAKADDEKLRRAFGLKPKTN